MSDITGKPLDDATVVLNDVRVVKLSNKDAKFNLVLPPGSYKLTLSMENYEDKTLRFEVKEGKIKRFMNKQTFETKIPVKNFRPFHCI